MNAIIRLSMGFNFYSTFYPPITKTYPITVDYSENSAKKLEKLGNHNGEIMVHSGNWWSMKNPDLRTPENILKGVKKIHEIAKNGGENCRFMGFMTCNEQPIGNKGKNLKNQAPYWIGNEKSLEIFNEKSIKNANWALDNCDISVPIYCTIQASNHDEAEKYFGLALESGHKYFSVGVSEFLKHPKYKFDGIKRIFEILIGIRKVVGSKYPIHLSGLSSFKLLPLAKLFGATSTDGSTPVQSALAYGTVFNNNGTGISASKLKEIIPYVEKHSNNLKIPLDKKRTGVLKWFGPEERGYKCKCEICNLRTIKQRIYIFNEGLESCKAGECRSIHNLFVWNSLINNINLEMVKSPYEWLEAFINDQKSHYSNKVLTIANEVRDSYL